MSVGLDPWARFGPILGCRFWDRCGLRKWVVQCVGLGCTERVEMTLLPASIQIQRTGSGGTFVILRLGVVAFDAGRWFTEVPFGTQTGRDGTGHDRTDDVHIEKKIRKIFVLKCYKFVFHGCGRVVPGGRGGTKNQPNFIPWDNPFHGFLAYQKRDGTPRPVPSRPVPCTKRTQRG